MIIILKRNANKEKVENLKTELVNQGFKLHLSEGTEASLIGLIGDTSRIHEDWLKANDVVEDVRRIREPYKKANRSMHPDDTVIDVCGRKIGGGGLCTGVSTLAKLLNPKIKVIAVEPAGAACLKASLEAGEVTTVSKINTIADGTAVQTPGDKLFPYLQANVDHVITVDDSELTLSFLDMAENHKMIVENSGLLTVAALKHLDFKGKKVVSVLSGGNMDVLTMATVVQNGLMQRDRIFTVSVMLPDKPGQLAAVSSLIAKEQGNVIKLEHNVFANVNRTAGVELTITLESFGTEHKDQIIKALEAAGYCPVITKTNGIYM